ncbi:MAG: tetratricopeptide repeat protein [Bacteroidota bacterium]
MLRLFILLLSLSATIYCNANRRDEIDQYNQETIDLLNDLDSCLKRVEYAIVQAENIHYDYGQAYGLYLKGYIHRMRNELGKAFLANLEGLNALKNMHDKRAVETQVRLYLNTGEILKKHFKYEVAIQYYTEGLALARKHNLTEWVIDLNYNIGSAYKSNGDFEQATRFIFKAYQLAQSEADEHTVVNALNLVGLISSDNHQYDTAVLFFNKMLDYKYKSLNVAKYKGRAYHNIATTYLQSGDTSEARNAYYQALELKVVRNKPSEMFITEYDLAELYYSQGNYMEAHKMTLRCIGNYENMRLHPDHYEVFDLARKTSVALEEHQQADHYANRYFEENKKFIKEQERLIEIRDQFKMEVLTASFFGELDRNKRISNLTDVIIWILVVSISAIAYMKIRQVWMKRVISRELDKLVRD